MDIIINSIDYSEMKTIEKEEINSIIYSNDEGIYFEVQKKSGPRENEEIETAWVYFDNVKMLKEFLNRVLDSLKYE